MLIKPRPIALAVLVMLSTPAWALSLGAPQALSPSDSAYVADIPLLDADDIPADAFLVRHANPVEYELQGVVYPVDIANLTLGVTLGADNRRQIQVQLNQRLSAERSVLLHISWPGNSLLQAVSLQPKAPEPVAPAPAVIETIPVVEAPAPAANDVLVVQAGDSLSVLASQWDQDLTLYQREQLIYQANPRAFVDGNINRLKAGARLRLPDLSKVKVPSVGRANAWYQQALAQATAPVSVPAVGEQPSSATSRDGAQPTQPSMQLIAEGNAEGSTSTGTDGAEMATSAEANAAIEAASREQRDLLTQRAELRKRLTRLTQENQAWDERLALVDEQIASLEEAAAKAAPSPSESEPVDEAAEVDANEASTAIEEAPAAQDESATDPLWVTYFYPLIVAAGLFFAFLLWLVLRNRRKETQEAAEHTEPYVSEPVEVAVAAPIVAPVAAPASEPEPVSAAPENTAEPDDEFAKLLAESQQAATVTDESEYDVMEHADTEAVQTRLDLAQAYLDMNEPDAAKDLLVRVVTEGNEEQQAKAQALLAQLQ